MTDFVLAFNSRQSQASAQKKLKTQNRVHAFTRAGSMVISLTGILAYSRVNVMASGGRDREPITAFQPFKFEILQKAMSRQNSCKLWHYDATGHYLHGNMSYYHLKCNRRYDLLN
jgi:hypothetical protein